jgi:mycothiol system anti-sigma-R factor
MSLEDLRPECADAAKLLQPYVDGELSAEDHERVFHHLASCAGCRAAVGEQQWVRTVLQSTEREVAPETLRGRILAELDSIDREATARRSSLAGRIAGRLRDLARGGMVMVPAGAVAIALFVAARAGVLPGGAETTRAPVAGAGLAGTTDDSEVLRRLEELRPQLDFPVQVAHEHGSAQLVGAGLDSDMAGPRASPGARLEYRVHRPGGAPMVVVHRQAQAAGMPPRGERRVVRGHRYYVDRDARGRPVVYVEVAGIAHLLSVGEGVGPGASENPPPGAYLTVLLDLARGLTDTSVTE